MSTSLKVKLDISKNMKDSSGNPIKVYTHDYYYKTQADKDKGSSTAYRECVSGRTVCGSPINYNTASPVCSCETKGSGSCAFDDSKWALYFWDNDSAITSGNIGYVHFKETCGSSKWHVSGSGSVGKYLVSVEMQSNTEAKVTIQLSAS
ncbi:hypothetical protein H2O64_15815 [Kordia sp. YSTF-M3]|uniref:Uncharacterized protein n=1 Tax=Kordia aestuariivivens TaxID=2759037 RepID=A0ABR7QCK9_9FLAO|nr:hypothetical protein [Kordia aestuariivivens]MBC8756143.1 hypothetical protein [Kordia aestuariivivens]